jgi:hypothetical protein
VDRGDARDVVGIFVEVVVEGLEHPASDLQGVVDERDREGGFAVRGDGNPGRIVWPRSQARILRAGGGGRRWGWNGSGA